MEKTISQLIAEMDKIEALKEQFTQGDKDTITKLYTQYKDEIQTDLKPLAARAYDAAINDKPLSSSDRDQVKQVYDQVMPQLPNYVKTAYAGMINRGVEQLLNPEASQDAPATQAQNAPATTAPAQAQAPQDELDATDTAQTGTAPAAAQDGQAAAVARTDDRGRQKIGTDAGDGLVWIVGNANALVRVSPTDPRVAAQKATLNNESQEYNEIMRLAGL